MTKILNSFEKNRFFSENKKKANTFNPFTAMLAASLLEKRLIEVPDLKSFRYYLPSHEQVKGLLPKRTVSKVDWL